MRFKSNLWLYLAKTFIYSLIIILVARFIEYKLSDGDVVIATYKVVVAWPVLITLMFLLNERSSINEVEVTDEGIKFLAYNGGRNGLSWKNISHAKHNVRKGLFPGPLWELEHKEGHKIMIPSGQFSREDEARLTEILKKFLSKNKLDYT